MESISEFLARTASERQQQNVAAGSMVVGSVEDKPDAVAGTLNLADEYAKLTGKPVPPAFVVQSNPTVFQKEIERIKASTALSRAPALAEWVRDPQNAALAKDDLEGLSGVETLITSLGNSMRRAGLGFGQSYNQYQAFGAAQRAQDDERSFGQILDDERTIRGYDGEVLGEKMIPGPGELWGATMRFLQSRMTGDDEQVAVEYQRRAGEIGARIAEIPMSPAGSRYRDAYAALQQQSTGDLGQDAMAFLQSIGQDPAGFAAFAGEVFAESLPQLGAMAGVAAVTRNPQLAAAVGGGLSGSREYGGRVQEFFQERGIDISTPEGAAQAMADPDLIREGMTRAGGAAFIIGALDTISGGVAGELLARNPMANVLIQGVAQALLGSTGEAGAQVAMSGRITSIADVMLEGMIEMIGTPIEVASVSVGQYSRNRERAAAAETRRAFFEELSGGAIASKLRERMPDAFRRFLERATENGPVENVYVPADKFQEYFQSRGIDPFELVNTLEGMTRADLETALNTGVDLRIPTATYAAKIAGSEHDAFLMDNMRFDPDEMTAVEAREFAQNQEQILAEAMEQAQDMLLADANLQTSEQFIYDEMVSQLRAAGRSPDVATNEAMLWPAFYRVMAQRAGISVEEMIQRYPLPRVQGEMPQALQPREVDDLTRSLAEARARKKLGEDRRRGLLEFISDYGGVEGITAELQGMDIATVRRPGRSTLRLAREAADTRQGEMFAAPTDGKAYGPDDVARAAIEAGYLADDPTVIAWRDAMENGTEAPDLTPVLLEAIRREAAGERQTSVQDGEGTAEVDQALVELEAYLDSIGVSLADDDAVIREAVERERAAADGRMYGQPETLEELEERLNKERDKITDSGKKPSEWTDVEKAVYDATTSPVLTGEDGGRLMAVAEANGRADLARYIAWRVTRAANAMTTTPGVSPENPRYDGIKADLEARKAEEVAAGAELTRRADAMQAADGRMYGQTATVRRGSETLKKFGLDPEKRYTTREVAAALEARQRKKYGTIERGDYSDEASKRIASWMVEETLFEVEQAEVNPMRSAVGWYSTKYQSALDAFGAAFPEFLGEMDTSLPGVALLGNRQNARDFFTALMAITSDGAKVADNFRFATQAYEFFRQNGRVNADVTFGGERNSSMRINLQNIQAVLEAKGADGMTEYLLRKDTVSNLKKIAKAEGREFSTAYKATMELPYSALIFGPKLGAFYANLMGDTGYLTMDRWWSRTFNRYRGTLLQQPTEAGLARFKELVTADQRRNTPASEMSDDEALALTVDYVKSYKAKGYKNGTEIEKAANTLYKAAFEGLEDQPFNASDREFMINTTVRAQKMLKRRGIDLTIADIQAVLWYYEKRLYGELGARQTQDISYEEIAKAVVAGRDIADGSDDAGTGDGGEPGVLDPVAAGDNLDGDPALDAVDEPFNAGVGRTYGQEAIYGRSEQTGDGAGRYSSGGLAPLEGAPRVAGAAGPDPRLVAVAEDYARSIGIELKRQAEFVEVDPERAARIAQAYEAMPHAPQDPAVREAYENLIQQTVAQYRALEAAGYEFFFFDDSNDPYEGNPWNAMRDLRANQRMGVYATEAGFGSGATELDVSDNPMLADTGIRWMYNGQEKRVLANDLFRAVHDAFGHGLEGAGFRARGEENAWQAHVRLFTGSAVAAITSETRGQNSWLNYGPYGEKNRTASVEETVFADQKTGLMPEWTWTEGRAADEQPAVDQGRAFLFSQDQRGSIQFPAGGIRNGETVVNLFRSADLSTFNHEAGHFFLTVMQDMAAQGNPWAQQEYEVIKTWWRSNAADVAKDAMRVMPDVQVTEADVIAALDNGTTGDVMKDAAIDVGMQEQWARGWEAYLMEGKAPSVELRGAFERFRAWLVAVYRRVMNLNVEVSPEIREVFDRMLATDAEIAEAKRQTGDRGPLFTEAMPGMFTEEEWTRYQTIFRNAEEEANQRLLAETMAPIRRQQEQWYREEKAKVRAEVERDVNARREYRALEWMGNRRWLGGETSLPDVRLSKQALVDRYGEGVLSTLPRGKFTIYAVEGGMDPDDAAGLFGFSSGDEMIRALERAPKRAEVIDAEVERIMFERHGDPLRDGTVQEKALEAVHGDRKARALALEMDVLNGRPGGTRSAVSVIREGVRQTMARMKVRDAMAANRYLVAERKAGEAAFRAYTSGDMKAAAEAKRRQLMNHLMYVEAKKIAGEVEAAERLVGRLTKKSTREKLAGDYLEAIDEILTRYDFRKMSNRAEERRGALMAYVERMKAEGRENELAIPDHVLQDMTRTPYKRLSVEHMRGVVDSLRNIEHTARLKKKLQDAQSQRDLDEVVEKIVGEFDANLPKRPPARVGDNAEARKKGMRQFLNLVLNAGTLLREIDGFKDLGPAYENMKAPIDRAMNRLMERRMKAADDLDALYEVYTKAERRKMAVREYIPEIGTSLSKWERIAVALNMGNEGNYQRMTDQRVRGGFTDAQVQAVISTLDERDARFVQSVWDYLETFRPDIEAREKRVTGVTPKWVEARPVTIGGVELKGGYYPLKYDPRLSSLARDDQTQDIATSLQAGRFGKAQTKNGHLKERAQSSGRAVDLDIAVLHKHVQQVVYDLELSEPVANSWRILQDGRIREAFTDAGRQADFDALEIWLKDVAEGEIRSSDFVGRQARRFKSNFTAAKLAFNLSTVAVQLTGLSQSMVVVGKKDFVKGWAASLRPGVGNEIIQKSQFMAERMTTFNKDIFDLYEDPRMGPVMSRWAELRTNWVAPLGFWLMTKVQFYSVDIPTWLAGYQQGLRRFGGDEAKAVEHADMLVKRAQASGLFSDRSAVERGSTSLQSRQNDFIRLFTALGSYMFAKFNVAYERTQRARAVIGQEGASIRSAGEVMSWTLDMAFLFTLEAVAYAAIKGRLPDEEDDEDGDGMADEWAKYLARDTALSMVSTIPFVRDLGGIISGFGGGGAYGAMTEELAKPLQQAAQGEVDAAFVKSIINATGLMTGAPSTMINRMVDAGWRQAEGEDVAPAEYLLGRIGN